MNLGCLHSSLLGSPLPCFGDRRSFDNIFVVKGEVSSTTFERSPLSQSRKKQRWSTFSQPSWWNTNFLWRNLCLSSKSKIKCAHEPSVRSKELFVRSFLPLWKEGLLLVRCSVFVAVLSAAGLLVWYGQFKSRSFIEAHLLPSVCSILSEYLQREINFGKVRSISPLGITLHSCSIGPHQEEFSCGELPIVKIRIRPFASMRRGKIVIDAVLYQPNILIAQKEDFSWLGIPSPPESSLKCHSSSEEGIDSRTKSRRVAREKASANWATKRSELARTVAKLGYIIPLKYSKLVISDGIKDAIGNSYKSINSSSFYCTDERSHRRDHLSVDTGVVYGLKHAELEKSFGIKTSSNLWFKFLPRLYSSPFRQMLKRKNHKTMTNENNISSKLRILKRSSAAALTHFSCLDNDKRNKDFALPMEVSSFADSGGIGSHQCAVKDEWIGDSKSSDLNGVAGTRQFETQVIPSYVNRNDLIGVPHETDASHSESQEITKSMSSGVSFEDANSSGSKYQSGSNRSSGSVGAFGSMCQPFLMVMKKISIFHTLYHNLPATSDSMKSCKPATGMLDVPILQDEDLKLGNSQGSNENSVFSSGKMNRYLVFQGSISKLISSLTMLSRRMDRILCDYLASQMQKVRSSMNTKLDGNAVDLVEGVGVIPAEGIRKTLPVTIDSVYFSGGSIMLLGYGDQEPREMEYVHGYVKFQNHYSRVHLQLSGNCMEWRSDLTSNDGGQLSADVFVDSIGQNWHANLNIVNLFAPLFERILEIPVKWSKGRATGEVHICMSSGETFPNLHGQLDVNDLAFEIVDAPSSFMGVSASLCFQGQRVFLHNASGWFGDAPLEASGDFGINPDDGEFHLMCQVPCVEVNDLMRTLKMKPSLFSLAGSITSVFNCQGPLDAPIFVGSGMISRKTPHLVSHFPLSPASEAVQKNQETGAVAAFDRIPFSHISANFSFNTDNCVADLYGIRATLLDGGEIRGAGNAWICPEGEEDESAMDINLSGTMSFDNVILRYLPSIQLIPLKFGELNGETKLSGSLLRPRFDIKWSAPKAEDSFSDARGNIIVAHEHITVTTSSVAFELYTKVHTVYVDDYWPKANHLDFRRAMPFVVEGVDLDLRMRGFEFANFISLISLHSPRPMHLKATGRLKFQGRVVKHECLSKEKASSSEINKQVFDVEHAGSLVGEVLLSGIKLNQLMIAPQLTGSLSISNENVKLDAMGRPDENFSMLVVWPFWSNTREFAQNKTIFSFALQKGQLKANVFYQPEHSANLEVRYLPLDELELASLRGTIQRAELQLNFQKRRGIGLLSVIQPKFSGILGEALDVAARWSGDVITIEKTVLEQVSSHYELQGEYVFPGSRDRYPTSKENSSLFEKAIAGQLGSIISSMGRWRLRLEVPNAEASEMLPLARLLSRSIDPAVRSRSKDFFMQNLQTMGFPSEGLHNLLAEVRNDSWPDDIIPEDIPGLAELKGRWHGSLDARGGGNGDTTAEFDFHGEDWEWGNYRSQRVLAVGAYSNNDGLRLEKMFIQKDDATIHADGTLLGPITNLHFAVLNFPIGLVPTVLQILDSAATDSVRSLCHLLAPIKGVLHMEGDLRGSIAKPECDVQVRLLDGVVGGIDLGRAEIVASLTPSSRFLFNVKFEPVIQSGHVHIQGSVPLACYYVPNDSSEEGDKESERGGAFSGWMQENTRVLVDKAGERKAVRERNEEGWDVQLAESLKGLNWNLLDDGEVRIDADIKDGGMMLITALSPHATWLQGHADINLQVRGTIEQPVLDGSANFHRASVSSPALPQPLTNLGGTIQIESNRLCINSVESKVSRKGKLVVKGNLPLNASESLTGDKIDLKCEQLKVQAKNILSGRVDCQMQITGSILQPNISGKIQLSHGEAYLPHDKRNGDALKRMTPKHPGFPAGSYNVLAASGSVSQFFGSGSASSPRKLPQPLVKHVEVEKESEDEHTKQGVDVRLTNLRLLLGPYLKIVYPLILNFAVTGELELNGMAHPKYIIPKGTLTFENGEVDLVATQMRLKREHLNIAKFEPDLGLDPILDLALVGSEWQFRVQSRASNWLDNLVVSSVRSVNQDALSPTEAARVFESELAESLLEGDGQLAFEKLATATLKKLMPRIEGKGEFGHARWRLVYAPQIPNMLSVEPTADPLKSMASNISFGGEVEVQLGKHLQASFVRQMKDSEMAMQYTLIYQLTNRLRVLLQSSPSTRLLFEYSATSQE